MLVLFDIVVAYGRCHAMLASLELGMRPCYGASILTRPTARHLYRIRREFSVLFAQKSRKCSQFPADLGFLCDKPDSGVLHKLHRLLQFGLKDFCCTHLLNLEAFALSAVPE
jgi:hypothetical protein